MVHAQELAHMTSTLDISLAFLKAFCVRYGVRTYSERFWTRKLEQPVNQAGPPNGGLYWTFISAGAQESGGLVLFGGGGGGRGCSATFFASLDVFYNK